ncbi:MAG: cytochrome P460 family protein [Xanthobacteraceae bacterium]
MRHRAIVQACGALGVFAVIGVCTLYVTKSTAQSAKDGQSQADSNASPIYGVTSPVGYRDWRLISVKRLTGKQLTGAGGNLKQLRAELGNDLGIKAYHDGTLPFPDGSIIAALHWNEESSDADNQALAAGFPGAGLQSSFAGSAVNAQFMVKDSKKYAASGGWGFADFTNGKPGNEALHAKCFPCHAPAKDRDYVFTRYAPTPGTK